MAPPSTSVFPPRIFPGHNIFAMHGRFSALEGNIEGTPIHGVFGSFPIKSFYEEKCSEQSSSYNPNSSSIYCGELVSVLVPVPSVFLCGKMRSPTII